MWTPEDEALMVTLRRQGAGYDVIAKRLNRSEGSVRTRMSRLPDDQKADTYELTMNRDVMIDPVKDAEFVTLIWAEAMRLGLVKHVA